MGLEGATTGYVDGDCVPALHVRSTLVVIRVCRPTSLFLQTFGDHQRNYGHPQITQTRGPLLHS